MAFNTRNWIVTCNSNSMNRTPCTYHCFGHHSSYVFSTIHLQNALFKGLKYYQTWMIPCTFAHLIMSKIFIMLHTFFRCFDTNMCNITNTRLGIYLVQRVLAYRVRQNRTFSWLLDNNTEKLCWSLESHSIIVNFHVPKPK